MRILFALIVMGGLAIGEEAPPPQNDDDVHRSLAELKTQLARQQAELAELRAALNEESAARKSAPAVFRLGGLDVRLSGFVQADAVAYDQSSADEVNFSTGQPINQTRFLLRRARLRVDAEYRYAGGVLEFDGNTINGVTARVTNAEVWARIPNRNAAQPPYALLTLGLTRIPFGFEVQEKDYVRLFLERSNVIRAMFPGEYDLGVKLSGGWRWLRYQLAAMNGNPSGDKQFALRDPNQSKDLLGRLGVDTPIARKVSLQAGLSGLWGTGFHLGSAPTKDTIAWHDTNLDGQVDPSELTPVPGMAGTPSSNFDRWAFGADLRLTAQVPVLGELALYAEVVWSQNLDRALYPADPVQAGRDLRELGWYVAATQQLTKWGAIGLRYDRYDPDADRTEKVGAQVVPRDLTLSTLSLTAAVMYAPYARLTLEWDHNQNALGRLASGAPATLGAEQVTFRGQVQF